MTAPTFEIDTSTVRAYIFREGWGVLVVPIWDGEDSYERVSDIEVAVVRIAPDTFKMQGNVPCVEVWPNFYSPIEDFADLDELDTDDSHDLRTRWFETETEARDHAASVAASWAHPLPWQSFVVFD